MTNTQLRRSGSRPFGSKKSSKHPSRTFSGRRRLVLEALEDRRLLSASPWQNPSDPYDVNNDSMVSPGDALVVINALNQRGSGQLVGITGEVGIVKMEIMPEGKVLIHGELWKATSAYPLSVGAKVRAVRLLENLVLEVEPVDKQSA